jgi:hypothetical protein
MVAAASPSMLAAAQAPPAATPSSPLTLHVTCSGRGEAALFRVQIVNTSDRPTAFVLGFTPTNTQAHVVNSIGVVAIRPATGAGEDFGYQHPKYALATGAPWIVSLAPGATHDVELPLKDFISGLNFSNLDPSVASGARLVLEARPAAKQSPPVWTGKIETPIEQCV